MEACILFCNRNKPANKKNKVIFINAVNEVTRKNAESFLEIHHIDKILQAFHAAEDIHQFKQTVKVEDIASNEFDISIQKYVFIKDDQDEVESLSTAILSWHKTKEKVHYHYNTLMDLI